MFNVCPQCGEYCVEKTIEPSDPGSAKTTYAICPFCHYAHQFLQQPLFIIIGASGAGKSTVCLALVPILKECVVMESDILWGMVRATSEDNYHGYRNTWLRVAKNIGQSGKPVVLCGTAVPGQFEACSERCYFSTLYYLAMVCDDSILAERLLQRPTWRQSGSPDFVERMLEFNRWLKLHAGTTKPVMTLLDTSHCSLDETVEEVSNWIRQRL